MNRRRESVAPRGEAMDIGTIGARLQRPSTNKVITYERGRIVERLHADVGADVRVARAALQAWGVRAGMRVGIRAPNSYAWLLYDLALIELRAVSVAFTDDFASHSAEDLCDRYSLSLMLVTAAERARSVTPAAHVAALDGENDGVRVRHIGGTIDDAFDRPWLIFSSGSAGGVKGIVPSRRGVEATVHVFTHAVQPRADDCLLLFLPMSNFQQRLMYYAALWYGFDIIVTDPARVFRALTELRPTTLIAPPALYEAFETRFNKLPAWKRRAARLIGRAVRYVPVSAIRTRLARAAFRQAHDALGGRMRFMVTGMAPIRRSVLDLFGLMQLPLYETYGLTECGSVTLNVPGACRVGSVGRVLPGVAVELAADGEIIVRRAHPTARDYFQCAEGEQERTFLDDGRVATGDIGRFDEDGYLYLIGRKKEIIISGGGEKIHPEAVEAEIDGCPDVAQSVVLGGDGLPGLVAVVRPRDPSAAAQMRRIERFIDQRNQGARDLAIGRVVFTDVVFSRDNGLLRPNLKLDRRRIGEFFRSQIAAAG